MSLIHFVIKLDLEKCKNSAARLHLSRWSRVDPVLYAIERGDVLDDLSQVLVIGGQVLLGQIVEIVDDAGEVEICPCELSDEKFQVDESRKKQKFEEITFPSDKCPLLSLAMSSNFSR